jgi:uncharacterized protein (DUF2236 family)
MSQAGRTPTRPTPTRPTPTRPVGPGSLLWRYAGDHRLAFTGISSGLLQLMHPAIGAGVAQHSNFFSDPWDRIIRSIPQIMGVIYQPDPEAIGRRVRNYHRGISGLDHLGRPYRALDPATFWWAHATFQYAAEQVVDRYDSHELTDGEREELYLDGVEWYRRYGVSMRPVPADRAAFAEQWERHLEDVLEINPAAERVIDMTLHDRTMHLKFLPGWTRPLQPLVITPVLRLTALGGLPAVVRRRFGIPWGIDDEVQYVVFRRAVAEAWRNLPASLRYGPTAAEGYRARRRRELRPADRQGAA